MCLRLVLKPAIPAPARQCKGAAGQGTYRLVCFQYWCASRLISLLRATATMLNPVGTLLPHPCSHPHVLLVPPGLPRRRAAGL